MSGSRGNRFASLIGKMNNTVDRFFARRGQARRERERDAESQRLASEFLKPREGGGFEGWARMRSGLVDSVLAPLALTHERLTFAPGDAQHERSVALADIVSVTTESMGMTVRSRDGGQCRLFFFARTGFDRGVVSDGSAALVAAWREAIIAAMSGREPAFVDELEAGESDHIEAAFNRVFDASALDEAPVRRDFAYHALGYPFAWHLSPRQQQGVRDVCRQLGERTIGRVEVEYSRARAEIFVEGDLRGGRLPVCRARVRFARGPLGPVRDAPVVRGPRL